MHLLGSGIFGAVLAEDISHFLSAPIFAFFGWYIIPFEALVLILQYIACRHYGKLRKITLVAHTALWAALGGCLAAILVPKEEDRVLPLATAAFVAGALSALFSLFMARSVQAYNPRRPSAS